MPLLVREIEDQGVLLYLIARHLKIELAGQQALLETGRTILAKQRRVR